MDKDVQYYTIKNLASWDQAAAVHHSIHPDLKNRVASASFDNLNKSFAQLLESYSLEGKSVAQLCCNNGLDLISIKKRGAGYCLGIDGSGEFVLQALDLAKASLLEDLDFTQHNAYQLPAALNQQFDFVVVTVGVLNWMPHLADFFTACAFLLKPGGTLLMEEIHPILNMYEEGTASFIGASYFQSEPYRDESGLDYFNHDKYQAKENYWFFHQFSDVLNAAITAQLSLNYIQELSENVANYCADLEHCAHNPPLAFIASWRKNSNQ